VPDRPAGEQDLQDLALRFTRAESYILALLANAAGGNPSRAIRQALEVLADLRRLDYRTPIVAAYLHQHPRGRAAGVADLAGSLARRLDTGTKTTAANTREAFTKVTADNVNAIAATAVTAAVDRQGVRWTLGRWADMTTTTIGRQATSRGITDREGEGSKVTIDTGDCTWCQSHAGDAIIGADPLPPYHPYCSCVAS
jgi:hypothetical protein